VLVQQTNAQSYSFIGSFDVFHPSFLNLEYFTPENEQENKNSLVITTFSGVPFSKDGVYIVEDIGKYINSISQIEPALVTKQLQWPNEATSVPFKIFNETAIGLGNGFLVPSKSTGYVSVIPSNTSIPHHLSEKKPDWFYHVAEWWDMNGDGLEDCVTARATVPTNGPSQGELVWFENPGSNQLSQTWQEHVVSSGPDIMIHLLWLDGLSSNEQPQIIAAEFFSTEIRLFWTENNSLWSNSENIQSVVIDNDMGSPFDIQYVDLNNDGKKDLLVTNHQGEADQSAVFAYTVPENWKTDPWPRYVLATNITTLKRGENQASPGRATAFHPNTNETMRHFIFCIEILTKCHIEFLLVKLNKLCMQIKKILIALYLT